MKLDTKTVEIKSYSLTDLTEEQVRVLITLCGTIHGSSNFRQISSEIYNTLVYQTNLKYYPGLLSRNGDNVSM
jgi:hypothetical protein